MPRSGLLVAVACLWVLQASVSPQFTPVSSELTGARGFARGVLNLVVLPEEQPFRTVSPWTILIAAALLLPLATVHPANVRPASRWAAAAAATIIVAVAVAPLVTPYRVVLAPRTFVLCLLLLNLSRVVAILPAVPPRSMPLVIGSVSSLFFASAALQTAASYGGNYSGFLHLAREVAERTPYLREQPDLARSLITYDAGYDGQFMYVMAFDPLLRRFKDNPDQYGAFIDAPPYRYGRIGFSALTTLVSGRRPERYPAVMIWLSVVAHFALGALLAHVAASHGISPFAALLYLGIPGFMSSLMSALPEALAASGLVAGFVLWSSNRPLLAAAAFGAALLVRETGIILLAALTLPFLQRSEGAPRRWMALAVALAPVALWRLYVASRLFSAFGWAALFTNPGDLGVPFAGLAQLSMSGLQATQPGAEVPGAIAFPVVLAAALILTMTLLRTRHGPFEAAAAVYAWVAVSLNYEKIWSHLPSGERGTFELFVCLLLLLLTSAGRPVWARRALTLFFGALLGYTFFIAPDAATSRAALGLIR